jgi:serine/threonine protein phosphatase PrpC
MHHEDRHLVSNVIGSPEMTIEIGPSLRLAPRDTVLLASDGLFDNLYIHEVVERIRKGPLDQAVERLATDSRRRMLEPEPGSPSKPDDLTIVALRRLPRPSQADSALAAQLEQKPS